MLFTLTIIQIKKQNQVNFSSLLKWPLCPKSFHQNPFDFPLKDESKVFWWKLSKHMAI